MSPLIFAALAVAGGVGASVRTVLDGFIRAHTRGTMPWGTIIINLTGSAALGLLAGLATVQLLPEQWHLIIGSGFLGGYTTFSTASFETVRLTQEGRWTMALTNGLGTLVAATACAGAGLWVGMHILL